MPAGYKIRGIAPYELRNYPDSVKLMFWSFVVDLGIKAKDRDLAMGLDAKGEDLRAISRKTRKYRKSEMTPDGEGDPSAPPLMPGRGLSRTRSLLAGRAFTTHAEFYWRFDPFTADTWAAVLTIHKRRGRDVFGLSEEATDRVKRQALAMWMKWKKAGAVAPVGLEGRRVLGPEYREAPAAVETVGRTSLEYATHGIGTPDLSKLTPGKHQGGLTESELRAYMRGTAAANVQGRPGAAYNRILSHIWGPAGGPTSGGGAVVPLLPPPRPPKPGYTSPGAFDLPVSGRRFPKTPSEPISRYLPPDEQLAAQLAKPKLLPSVWLKAAKAKYKAAGTLAEKAAALKELEAARASFAQAQAKAKATAAATKAAAKAAAEAKAAAKALLTPLEAAKADFDELTDDLQAAFAKYKAAKEAGKPATLVDKLNKKVQAAAAKFNAAQAKYEALLNAQFPVTAPAPAPAPIPAAPPIAPAAPVPTLNIPYGLPHSAAEVERLEVVKSLGGGGGGGGAKLVKDSVGKQYVMKTGDNPGHIANEVNADLLYHAAGIDVPKSALYQTSDGLAKVATFKEGYKTYREVLATGTAEEIARAKEAIREGFAADALFANWDVIGADTNPANAKGNVLIKFAGGSAKVFRIDNGGALNYKGTGGFKPFTADVNELETLRDPRANPSAGEVFKGLTDAEVKGQIKGLWGKRAAILDAAPAHLKGVIGERLDNMAAWAGIDRPKVAADWIPTDAAEFKTFPSTEPAHKWASKVWKDWAEGLSTEQKEVIQTHKDSSYSLARRMRDAEGDLAALSPEDRRTIEIFDSAMHARPTPEPVTVVRYFDLSSVNLTIDSAKPGTEFQDHSFISTSINPHHTWSGHRVEIRVPAGAPAGYSRIIGRGSHGGEYELTLGREVDTFRVVEVKDDHARTMVVEAIDKWSKKP